MVLDLAQNSSYSDFSEITKKMDSTERACERTHTSLSSSHSSLPFKKNIIKVFKAAHDSTVSLQEWRDRKAGTIETSESVVGNGRKRRFQ